MSEFSFYITCRTKPEKAEEILASYMEAIGFSFGRKQAGSPRGIMLGSYDIQKWRNLSREDVTSLHGHIVTYPSNSHSSAWIFSRHGIDITMATTIANAINNTPFPTTASLIQYRFVKNESFNININPDHAHLVASGRFELANSLKCLLTPTVEQVHSLEGSQS